MILARPEDQTVWGVDEGWLMMSRNLVVEIMTIEIIPESLLQSIWRLSGCYVDNPQ